ncbi:MAG: ComEC/Rec2 family competence protein [Prevotella sp.]|nr:ComEC/Rec2 family competence protein [Prevotella sp.]
MRHQRIIAPLLPVALSLIIGIIIGKYLILEATITLTALLLLVVCGTCLFRFPKLQTATILLLFTVAGCHLTQHPLPDIPSIQRASERMLEYRQQLLEQLQQDMPSEQYAVVAAMTLGDRSELTPEAKQAFYITGAAHVLALSGLHLGIIYMIVSLIIRGRQLRTAAQILTLLLLWAFAFLVGLSPSIVRSATMLTIYGLLSLGYRQRMSINVLAFTAIVMLIVHPHALFEVGFQMSFLAVLAILVFYPILNGIISERWLMEHQLVRWLWGMTTLSLSAQIGVAPLIAFYFHRFSTYFLLANFIVIPCAYLILTGVLLLFLSHQLFFATALTVVAAFMHNTLNGIANLPYASIEGLCPTMTQTALTYVLICCVWIISRKAVSHMNDLKLI